MYPLSAIWSAPTTESATWCLTPAAASAARMLRVDVSKNSSTALSSHDGAFVTSTTTSAPASASHSPSPVMVLTPDAGEADTASWPRPRSRGISFLPMSPLPPITTIFMLDLLGCGPDIGAVRAHLAVSVGVKTAGLLRQPGHCGPPEVHELAGAILRSNAHRLFHAIRRSFDGDDEVSRLQFFDVPRQHLLLRIAEEEPVDPFERVDSLGPGDFFDVPEAGALQRPRQAIDIGWLVDDAEDLSRRIAQPLALIVDLLDTHGVLLMHSVVGIGLSFDFPHRPAGRARSGAARGHSYFFSFSGMTMSLASSGCRTMAIKRVLSFLLGCLPTPCRQPVGS